MTVRLNLRLQDGALKIVDSLLDPKRNTREKWAFHTLHDCATQWALRWNLLQALGKVAVDPQGRLTIRTTQLRPLPLGDGEAGAQLHVAVPESLADRLLHVAQMTVAGAAQVGSVERFDSVTEWAQDYLATTAAMQMAQLEARRDKVAVEEFEKEQLVERERARRRGQLEAGGQAPVESPSVAGFSEESAAEPPSSDGSSPT